MFRSLCCNLKYDNIMWIPVCFGWYDVSRTVWWSYFTPCEHYRTYLVFRLCCRVAMLTFNLKFRTNHTLRYLNSSDAIKVFRMQNKVIKLIIKSWFSDLCRPNFRRLKTLPSPFLYIFWTLLFYHSNLDKFYSKNHVHNHISRNSSTMQYPNLKTTFLEKALWYFCTTIVNNLPSHIIKEPFPCAWNFFWATAFIASSLTLLGRWGSRLIAGYCSILRRW